MIDDPELLRRYAEDRSEEAFAELVQRHLGWIYRTALRRTGRVDFAQDVAQYVFIALAEQAAVLSKRDQLAGWFYLTVRNAAFHLRRSEARRRARELAAAMTLYEDLPADDWASLRPILDEGLDHLAVKDREALILRFFEGKTFEEIGQKLQLGEDGARKRVERALDRLEKYFSRRGLASGAAVLTGLMTAEGTVVPPTGFGAIVTQAALTGPGWSGSSVTLLQLMSATKITVAGIAVTIAIGIAALGTATVAWHEMSASRAEQRMAGEAEAKAGVAKAAAQRAQQSAQQAIADLAKLKAQTETARSAQAARQRDKAGPAAAAMAERIKAGRENAKEFFAQYDQAKGLAQQLARAQVMAGDALFYRVAGLTPAQKESLIAQTTDKLLNSIIVLPNAIVPTDPGLSDDQLRAILNDDQFAAYKQTQLARPAVSWAGALALSTAEAGMPMPLDETAALAQVVTSNSPEYASGKTVDPTHVDWDQVYVQAQKMMTPAEWEQVQPAIQLQSVMQQWMAAAREESTQ